MTTLIAAESFYLCSACACGLVYELGEVCPECEECHESY